MAKKIIRVGARGGCNPDVQEIKQGLDTVQWESEAGSDCVAVFRGRSPFTRGRYRVPRKSKSVVARQRKGAGTGLYRYTMKMSSGSAVDPAIDIKP
jgi:hypothetical protein